MSRLSEAKRKQMIASALLALLALLQLPDKTKKPNPEDPVPDPNPDPGPEPGPDPIKEPAPEPDPGPLPGPDPIEEPAPDPAPIEDGPPVGIVEPQPIEEPDPVEEPAPEPEPAPEEDPVEEPTNDPVVSPERDYVPDEDPAEEPAEDPVDYPDEQPGRGPATPEAPETPGEDPTAPPAVALPEEDVPPLPPGNGNPEDSAPPQGRPRPPGTGDGGSGLPDSVRLPNPWAELPDTVAQRMNPLRLASVIGGSALSIQTAKQLARTAPRGGTGMFVVTDPHLINDLIQADIITDNGATKAVGKITGPLTNGIEDLTPWDAGVEGPGAHTGQVIENVRSGNIPSEWNSPSDVPEFVPRDALPDRLREDRGGSGGSGNSSPDPAPISDGPDPVDTVDPEEDVGDSGGTHPNRSRDPDTNPILDNSADDEPADSHGEPDPDPGDAGSGSAPAPGMADPDPIFQPGLGDDGGNDTEPSQPGDSPGGSGHFR